LRDDRGVFPGATVLGVLTLRDRVSDRSGEDVSGSMWVRQCLLQLPEQLPISADRRRAEDGLASHEIFTGREVVPLFMLAYFFHNTYLLVQATSEIFGSDQLRFTPNASGKIG
jgi:hypothetical protein